MAKRKRPIIGVQRRYSWRLYPTQEQDAGLRDQARMCAELWNALMEMWETINRRCVQRQIWIDADGKRHVGITYHGQGWKMGDDGPSVLRPKDIGSGDHRGPRDIPSEFDMGYWITSMLAECPEWRALSTWTPRRVATSVRAAWQAFFRRAKAGAGASAGYPMYKSAYRHLAIPHRCLSGCSLRKSVDNEWSGPNSYYLRLKGAPGKIRSKREPPWDGAEIYEWMDADVRLIDGNWEISAAVDIARSRRAAMKLGHVVIRFDLLDCFCTVNGKPCTPPGFADLMQHADKLDRMKSEFDLKWPRRPGKRWSDDEWRELRKERENIARFEAYIARCRRDILHAWTAQIVAKASSLTVIKPSVRENTKTPRGNAKEWGAAVEAVSSLNRNTLSYAPALAAQMLEYKAKELLVWSDPEIVTDCDPKIGEGADLVAATKANRRASRALKKEIENGVPSSEVP